MQLSRHTAEKHITLLKKYTNYGKVKLHRNYFKMKCRFLLDFCIVHSNFLCCHRQERGGERGGGAETQGDTGSQELITQNDSEQIDNNLGRMGEISN